MDARLILQYYSRKEVQEAIFQNAANREVAVKFGESGFGKRPDILQYPRDVFELAKEGATSFHASEELWSNPLALSPNLKRKELDALRIGWDLLLDIDTKHVEFSKIAAFIICKRLKLEGIRSVSLKFSGGNGFHIGIPFESFPDRVGKNLTKDLFPEGPRQIAARLKEKIKDELMQAILNAYSFEDIQKLTGKGYKELVINNQLNPFSLLDIDTVLISSRHLYRMPYTLNEKSWLVSIPVDPMRVLQFQKSMAAPENVIVKGSFIDRNAVRGEARRLLLDAFDTSFEQSAKQPEKTEKQFEIPSEAISAEYFPPCIKLILDGLSDGKKRALFVLLNFLSSVGYSYEEMENIVRAWNEKNAEPLRENYILGQLKYHKLQRKKMPPPNCDNKAYMIDIGVCKPDNFCQKIRNPAQYTLKKVKLTAIPTKKRVKKEKVDNTNN
ncbi:hypothetical protein HYV81_00240 [Candidatus Woesearchaeota archaeon]|nr:hypothetical protein [Candidatus Woesearchaeota archaeon]